MENQRKEKYTKTEIKGTCATQIQCPLFKKIHSVKFSQTFGPPHCCKLLQTCNLESLRSGLTSAVCYFHPATEPESLEGSFSRSGRGEERSCQLWFQIYLHRRMSCRKRLVLFLRTLRGSSYKQTTVDPSTQAERRALELLFVEFRKLKELYYIALVTSLQKSVASGTWLLDLNLSSTVFCLSNLV